MKKVLFFLILIFAALLSTSASAEGFEPERAKAVDCTFETDDDGQSYVFRFSEPVTSMYFVWDTLPGRYIAAAGTRRYVFGKDGFLHECIFFDEAVSSAELVLEEPTAFLEAYAFTPGVLPDFVQVWRKPCEKADMLIFSTHADDEYIWFGGLIPYYAGELDLAVQVAYLTSHEIRQPQRMHEILNGLWKGGVENYPVVSDINDVICWTLADAMKIYGRNGFTQFEVEQIRRFKPSVIVSQAEDGESGHGAHVLGVKCLREAVEAAADETRYSEAFEKYGAWDTPKFYIHMYENNRIIMDWHEPLEAFGGLDALEAAELAYQCYKSQLKYGYEIEESGDCDCRIYGLYRSTVGADTGNDMMENLSEG